MAEQNYPRMIHLELGLEQEDWGVSGLSVHGQSPCKDSLPLQSAALGHPRRASRQESVRTGAPWFQSSSSLKCHSGCAQTSTAGADVLYIRVFWVCFRAFASEFFKRL